jgi:uncharacterized protein YciI
MGQIAGAPSGAPLIYAGPHHVHHRIDLQSGPGAHRRPDERHVKFLKKYYAAGNFLVSGRKIPRDGGIIVASGASREQIEAIMNEDPFCKHALADVRVIEFRASQRARDWPLRIEPPTRE